MGDYKFEKFCFFKNDFSNGKLEMSENPPKFDQKQRMQNDMFRCHKKHWEKKSALEKIIGHFWSLINSYRKSRFVSSAELTLLLLEKQWLEASELSWLQFGPIQKNCSSFEGFGIIELFLLKTFFVKL